ncbi:uncharacterized protein METZ01_LOCUS393298, partial [marine metagenome]
AHLTGGQGVVSSNLAAPTLESLVLLKIQGFFVCSKSCLLIVK